MVRMRWIAGVSLALGGCAGVEAPPNFGDTSGGATSASAGTTEGTSTGDAPLEPEPDPFFDEYAVIQAEAAVMDVDDLLVRYPGRAEQGPLSYDPHGAIGLDAITQVYPLDAAQDEALATNGFVALASSSAYTFEDGYHAIYDADLPVMVTTDSVLYALHRSFDSILARLEHDALIPELDALLSGVHAQLAEPVPEALAQANEDLDVVVTVARRLLLGVDVAAVTGAVAEQRADAIMLDIAALAPGRVELFGSVFDYDYSQLEPRGHYTDDPAMQQYFRAMMWLGRTEARLVEYDEHGAPLFRRTAADAVFLFDRAMREGDVAARWERIERVLATLIGDPDNMTPRDGTTLVEQLGAADLEAWAALADEAIHAELVLGDYGNQRIMSQIMFTDPTDPPLTLPRSWLVLGQRFTIDSYVFHNVTYDRVQDLRTGDVYKRQVLYMHDGQNLFAPDAPFGGWQVGAAVDDAIASGALPPMFVVGIDNTPLRFDEYTPVPDDLGDGPVGGRADEYADFVALGIKPFIDARYPTRADAGSTVALGSSLGGLVSLYIAWRHPDVFGLAGSMSGTLDWGRLGLDNDRIVELFEQQPPLGAWLYLDSGGDGPCPGGSDNYCVNLEMRGRLAEIGWSEPDSLVYVHAPGASHDEAAWRDRLPGALGAIGQAIGARGP